MYTVKWDGQLYTDLCYHIKILMVDFLAKISLVLSEKVIGVWCLCGRSVLVSVAAILRVVTLTGQADVAVIAVGSGTATLVELTTNWRKGFSILRRYRS